MNTWSFIHAIAVAVGLLLYVKRTHNVGRYRAPGAAFAWVLALLLLPYVALPAFYILARRKQHDIRPIQWRPGELKATGPFAQAIGLPPARWVAEPLMLIDGQRALDGLIRLIDSASVCIDFETFIFADDRSGAKVVESLVRALDRGVQVRILVDELGNKPRMRRITHQMIAAGLDLRPFGKIRGLRSLATGNLRNHRKQVIVDRQSMWCGGRNIADEYFDTVDQHGWSDLSYILRGSVIHDAATLFECDWQGSNQATPPIDAPTAGTQDHQVRLVPSGPDFTHDTFHALLLDRIGRATQRVWIATPYYVPDDEMQNAVIRARLNGADVRLVTPFKSNHALADFARKRSVRELIANGVGVYLLPHMSHAKLTIIDDTAICGSHNFDTRSFFLNYELSTEFLNAADVAVFAQWYESQQAISSAAAFRQPSLTADLAEGLIRSIAYQL